jgi:2'-5' RNA ligase
VQSVLSAALARGGWYRPEPRSFLPHATVARVRRGGRVPREPPSGVPQISFDGTDVTLYRSHLDGAGARYEALRRVELGASAGGAPLTGE